MSIFLPILPHLGTQAYGKDCKSIWAQFWSFLNPYCAYGPHIDHNLKVYYLSVESAKKWTMILDSFHFFNFFSDRVIFRHFRPLGGV